MNDTSTAAAPAASAPGTTAPTMGYPDSQPSNGYYNYGTTSVPGYGQSSYNNTPPSPAMLASLGILLIIFYVYIAIILYKLAKKTSTANPGLAWVPIVNIYTFVKVGGKPGWWVILLFIPLVNIVIAIILWMQISRRVNKPDYLGILMIIPLVNIIIPAYLAFSNTSSSGATPPAAPMVPPTAPPSSPTGM